MAANAPDYIWNNRIHQRWASEDLVFWRLAFFPGYKRGKVLDTVNALMKSEKVRSYAVYEALGLFDIFIRTWLPSQSFESFEKKLNHALHGEYLQLLESFRVTRILRHHVWDEGKTHAGDPPQEILESPFSDAEIAKINKGRFSDDRRKELEDQKIIAKLPSGDGIKFFTIITSPVYPMVFEAREQLEEKLLELLDEAGVEEVSLYEGSGFGRFVVMGRSPIDNFFAIPELAGAINDLGINDSLTARPYTHVCSEKGVLVCIDQIPTKATQEKVDLEELLSRPESHDLEVKATLKLDLAPWLISSGDLESKEFVANDGVIKAVVGMLNARGGRVVVGAIERKDKFKSVLADDHPKLTEYERVGDYIVFGVDEEEQFGAGGWDAFQRQLQDLIGSRIDPSPAGLISIDEEKLGGKTLCVISVRPSSTRWFYRRVGAKDPVKFYIREAGRTIAYAGSDADRYKEENPRN